MATSENFYIGKVFNYYSVLYSVTIIKKKKMKKITSNEKRIFFLFVKQKSKCLYAACWLHSK